MERNLAFVRIDDRLIHGQVVAAWLRTYGNVSHIIVVDDKVSTDQFMQQMFKMLVPSGISIEILSVENAVNTIKNGLNAPTMIIVKIPDTIKRMVDAGVDISRVNIGGMGMTTGRKKLFQNISSTPEENAIFKQLIAGGIIVEIQIIPAAKTVNVANLLK
ncbi:MAG TPA: PTS sugar transporter subunit IIB [Anaerovoracaceae bacterium]|nr:PTS sugar transporter subunit IIB [Anaerovoracaceae bacterium]